MSLEKLIAESINEKPLEVQEIFEAEMKSRMLVALEEKFKQSMHEADEDEDEDDDDDEDEDDEADDETVGNEMKKLHASKCTRTEVYKKIREKYGCTNERLKGLYASYCKG